MYPQVGNTINVTGEGMDTARDQPRWVAEQVSRLRDALDGVEKSITSISERLQPVLAPDSPHNVLSDKEDTPSRSPLADDLAIACDRAYMLAERVRHLEGRLEI